MNHVDIEPYSRMHHPDLSRNEPWSITLPILNIKLNSISSIEDAAVGTVVCGDIYNVFFKYNDWNRYFIKLTSQYDKSIVIRHSSRVDEALESFMKQVIKKIDKIENNYDKNH